MQFELPPDWGARNLGGGKGTWTIIDGAGKGQVNPSPNPNPNLLTPTLTLALALMQSRQNNFEKFIRREMPTVSPLMTRAYDKTLSVAPSSGE